MSRFGWYVRVRLRKSITKDWVLLRMHTTMHKQLQTYSYSTDPSNSQQEKERGREPSKLEKICTLATAYACSDHKVRVVTFTELIIAKRADQHSVSRSMHVCSLACTYIAKTVNQER